MSDANSGEITAIEVDRVTKSFGQGSDLVTALDRVSVTIRQNEFFTLLGPSGCGKTTLLRLIAGFDLPTEGLILLEGTKRSATSRRTSARSTRSFRATLSFRI